MIVLALSGVSVRIFLGVGVLLSQTLLDTHTFPRIFFLLLASKLYTRSHFLGYLGRLGPVILDKIVFGGFCPISLHALFAVSWLPLLLFDLVQFVQITHFHPGSCQLSS